MARSILVLIAALPALAQYNAALYNVKPSGGAVGQVCFYETVANGSNKVCLVGPASQAGDTTIDVTTLTSPPFVDSGAIVKGSVDATKLLAFEVDGFTTATTRTVTVPDASFIMAGRNVDNAFSANQTFGAHILFNSASTRDIGDPTNYFQTAYGENIDLAPAGVTGNYANIRKLNVVDKNGGTSFYDLQSQHAVSASNFVLRDPAGTEVLKLERVLASATVDNGIIDMNWVPKTDHARSLGATGADWLDIHWDGSLIHNGTTVINSSRHWAPSSFLFASDGSSSIGSSSANRPGTIHVGAGTAGGSGVLVYNGSVLRMLVAPPYLSLYNNSSVEVIRLDSNSGDAIFAGAVTCGSGCGGAALPVSDSTSIVEDNGDPTKEVRIEASGITTGTVRVWTAPNANITVAGINLAQTWTAAQTFADIFASTIQSGGFNFLVDSSGNTTVESLTVNGTSTINSSRAWVAGNLLFGTDSTYSVGATTSGRPASYYAGGGGFYAYSGSTLRAFMDISNFALYNGSAVNKYVIDTSTGNTTSAGYNSSTSYQVSGTEVVSSGRIGKFVSLDINGTTDRINSSGVFNAASYSVAGTSVVDSSRNASFVSLTINGTSAINSSRNTNFNNLVWTNQLWGPYTADTGLSFASSAGKIAYYDTSGVFKGWIPVLP